MCTPGTSIKCKIKYYIYTQYDTMIKLSSLHGWAIVYDYIIEKKKTFLQSKKLWDWFA